MAIELDIIGLSKIDDDRLHPTIISPDYKTLIIYKGNSIQPTDAGGGSILGYTAVTGRRGSRRLENEASTEFGEKLKNVLKNPFRKIQII